MRIFLIALALIILLCGCLEPQETTAETVEYGDNVSAYYTLYVEGEMFQTNNESAARAEGRYELSKSYDPLVFKAVLGGELIDGFVQNVIGMEEGETKEFILPPSEGYGLEDPAHIYNVSRFYERNITEVVPVEYFEEKNIEIKDGVPFNTDIGTVFISGHNDTHVNITYVFEVGDKFYFQGIPQRIIDGHDGIYRIELDVFEDSTYNTISPISGDLVKTRAEEITNDTIVFNENHPLSGKHLNYTVTVVNIEKE